MGIEYQIIDDKNYPETKADPEGVSSTGSVYLIYVQKEKYCIRQENGINVRLSPKESILNTGSMA